jgi:hypothetical protein
VRKLLVALLLLGLFPFAQRPAEVQASGQAEWRHWNRWVRYDYVEVNDISKPIYKTSAPTPILKDRREYKIVRYEQTYELKTVEKYETRRVTYIADYERIPQYETRTERYVAYYDERPRYEARTETYVAYYDERPIIATRYESYLVGYSHERVQIGSEPVYSTRQVCTFRWRGSCREWGTERYVSSYRPVYGTRSTPIYGTRPVSYVAGISRTPVYATRTVMVRVGMDRIPVYATRTERVFTGYRREPVYATRTERVLVGTTTVKVPAGQKPIWDWVLVCSACEIEGYTPGKKVLVGYEKKTVSVPSGEKDTPCPLPGTGDCSEKNRKFMDGAWHEYNGHYNVCQIGTTRVDPSRCSDDGGGRGTTSVRCEDLVPPQVTGPDGNCVPRPPETVDLCRDGTVMRGVKLTEINLLTDTPLPCAVKAPVCPAGSQLAGQNVPPSGDCNPVKAPVCPAGSQLAGQNVPPSGDCNPVKAPVCPAGSQLAGQNVPPSGDCNPVKAPVCPAGSQLAGQNVPPSGDCNPVKGSDVTEPDVTEPDVTEPGVTEPDVTEPGVTEPEKSPPTTIRVRPS